VLHLKLFGLRKQGYADCTELAKRGDAKGLVEKMRDVNDSQLERTSAIDALGYLGDPVAVKPLIEFINGKNSIYQNQLAVTALGKIGDKKAVDAMLQLYNSEESEKLRIKNELRTALLRIARRKSVEGSWRN